MKNLKALIFDMDGVVVDNHHFHFAAWMKFSEKYNFDLNDKIYRESFNGKTNKDLFTMIFGDISEETIRAYGEEKEQYYRHIYEREMRPHKGLLDFLDYLRKMKIKIALGTSAPTSNVDFTMDKLKLRKYFDVIVDGTHVEKGKPDPQVYQLCCEKLGLRPQNCLVFEDALLGIEAGLRAGMRVVGVATTHRASELMVKTDLVIHDFTEGKALLRKLEA